MKITHQEILDHWHTHAPFWLMEEPRFMVVKGNAIAKALEKADPNQHEELIVDCISANRYKYAKALLENEKITSAIVDAIALSKVAEKVASEIIYHPKCDPKWVTHFARSRNVVARVCTARHPSLSQELIIEMSKDPSSEVQSSLAGRDDLPQEAIDNLFKSQDYQVLTRLADWVKMTTSQFCEIANQDDHYLSWCLGSNKYLPIEAMNIILDQRCEHNVEHIAMRQDLDRKTVERLLAMNNKGINHCLIRNLMVDLKLIEHLCDSAVEEDLEYLARRPDATPELLVKIARKNYRWVNHRVHEHSNCPKDLKKFFDENKAFGYSNCYISNGQFTTSEPQFTAARFNAIEEHFSFSYEE